MFFGLRAGDCILQTKNIEKVRVLITIPCLLIGGTEIQTLNLVRALVEGGHEVTTACFFEHTDYMIEQYEKTGSKVALFSKAGVRIGGIAGIWFLFKHLRNLKRSLNPDAVHVQYMAPGAIPIILLWLMGQKNILATAHTNADIYSSKQLKLVQFIQKHITRVFTCITLKAETAFFGSSNQFKQVQTSSKLPKHSHWTIYNSLPEYIHITDKVREPKGVIIIGVVSRLEAIKGMDLVVPAFKRVYEKHKNIHLLVVGDGSLRKQMESESSEISHLTSEAVNPLTLWVGRQGQDTLESYYDQIDILLMPSRSEGFGLTAIESMARGCVVVAANTGGLSEVIKDGEIGLLHKPEDVNDLSDKICQLIDNTELYQKMHTRTHEYVKCYSFERFSILFNSVYSRL